jgi:hypothetical protein
MHPILRVILGVVMGILVSACIVAVVETLCFFLFVPRGTNIADPETVRAVARTMPPAALGMVLAGWAIGAFVGTFLAARIARGATYGIIVGAILLTAAITNMMSFPHPGWMWGGAIVLYFAMTALGTRLGAPKGGVAPPAAPAQA